VKKPPRSPNPLSIDGLLAASDRLLAQGLTPDDKAYRDYFNRVYSLHREGPLPGETKGLYFGTRVLESPEKRGAFSEYIDHAAEVASRLDGRIVDRDIGDTLRWWPPTPGLADDFKMPPSAREWLETEDAELLLRDFWSILPFLGFRCLCDDPLQSEPTLLTYHNESMVLSKTLDFLSDPDDPGTKILTPDSWAAFGHVGQITLRRVALHSNGWPAIHDYRALATYIARHGAYIPPRGYKQFISDSWCPYFGRTSRGALSWASISPLPPMTYVPHCDRVRQVFFSSVARGVIGMRYVIGVMSGIIPANTLAAYVSRTAAMTTLEVAEKLGRRLTAARKSNATRTRRTPRP
jgi:hypothetical protein